jgi:hypothetical protein
MLRSGRRVEPRNPLSPSNLETSSRNLSYTTNRRGRVEHHPPPPHQVPSVAPLTPPLKLAA